MPDTTRRSHRTARAAEPALPYRPPSTRVRVGRAPVGAPVVRRARAVAEVPGLGTAVWSGEVVIVAGARSALLAAVGRGVVRRADGRTRLAWVPAASDGVAGALAAAARSGAGVIALVPTDPASAAARRQAESLRRAVARRVPARCVWLRSAGATPFADDC